MTPGLDALFVVGLLLQRPMPAIGPPPVAPETRVPPARRGRWGMAIGIARIDADATYDFRNSATPNAGATGPYADAIIPLRYRWLAPYVSTGYRGAVAGSRVGFGVEAEISICPWAGAPSPSTAGTSPAGVPVAFTIETGGIQYSANAAASAHVSYQILPRLNLMAGGKETRLMIGSAWNRFRGPAQTNDQFFGAGHIPRFTLNAFVPWVGLEYFLGNHRSLQLAAEFPPTATTRLATTPWDLTFRRHVISLAAAIRFFR